jgi:hypothetical protein
MFKNKLVCNCSSKITHFKYLFALVSLLIFNQAHAFEYRPLELDKGCLVEDASGDFHYEMPCKSKATQVAVQSCLDAKGEIGRIDKQTICKLPENSTLAADVKVEQQINHFKPFKSTIHRSKSNIKNNLNSESAADTTSQDKKTIDPQEKGISEKGLSAKKGIQEKGLRSEKGINEKGISN